MERRDEGKGTNGEPEENGLGDVETDTKMERGEREVEEQIRLSRMMQNIEKKRTRADLFLIPGLNKLI